MNCVEFEERIAEYVDGGLDRGELRLVEQHLQSCPACAKFADELEDDRVLLRTLPPESAEVDFAALRSLIRMAIAQERRASRLVPALLIAASILIAVGIAAIRLVPGRIPPPPPPVAQVSVPGRVGQALSPAKRRRIHSPSTAPVPQADPALEAALREFVAADKAPEVSPEGAPPVEIRIVTSNPNVVLILLQESSGVSNE